MVPVVTSSTVTGASAASVAAPIPAMSQATVGLMDKLSKSGLGVEGVLTTLSLPPPPQAASSRVVRAAAAVVRLRSERVMACLKSVSSL
ncbi:hypothetical protein D9M69_646290 [compost metagenome]